MLMSPICEATNGYFPHGWGTRSGAMAGAGAAMAEDAMAAATNPAALAALPDDQFTLGLSLIHAEPGYRASSFPPPAQPPPAGRFPLQPGNVDANPDVPARSEEHTSELQTLMRNLYAVFCLKKKKKK